MSLRIDMTYKKEDKMWIIKPQGEIDIYTSPEFKEEVLKKFSDMSSDILIDGEGLDYIDSTGLGALISIYKVVKEKDNIIYIENLKANIRKLFDITDLDKIFVIKE